MRIFKSVLFPLIVGTLAAVAFDSATFNALRFSTWAVFFLFVVVGSHVNQKEISRQRNSLLLILLVTTAVAFILTYGAARLLSFNSYESLLISAVLLSTGAGVTVQTLLHYRKLGTQSAQFLVLMTTVEDLPPAFIIVWLMSSGNFQSMNGFVSIFGGILSGWLLAHWTKAGPSILSFLEKYFLFWGMPIYYFYIGSRMVPRALAERDSVLVLLIFLIVACGSKWASSYFLMTKWPKKFPALNPKIVSWGMVARGVPGLAFATISFEAHLINQKLFTLLVSLVALTTWLGLYGLGRQLKK